MPEPTDMLFYEIRTMSLSAFVHAIDGMDPNAECRVSGGTLLTWAAVGGTFCVAPRPDNHPSENSHPCFVSLLNVLNVGEPPHGHRHGTAVAWR